jgi:coatomer protein complex subunit epsilon
LATEVGFVAARQEDVLSTVADWVADPACAGNATTLLVAGIIYANEGNEVEALKACHTGLTLEM